MRSVGHGTGCDGMEYLARVYCSFLRGKWGPWSDILLTVGDLGVVVVFVVQLLPLGCAWGKQRVECCWRC